MAVAEKQNDFEISVSDHPAGNFKQTRQPSGALSGVFFVFSCSLRFFSSVFGLYATISTCPWL
ncbi:MAG TPA: hypothetical protein VE616_02095, partial [Candidatus Udaeobacter sp.]|nr:hypothetical protein [Candidatus Udaeobacter sp.]